MKNTMKKPVAIPVEKLRPFAGHPFKVKDDDEMNTLIESIQTQGVLSPLIVRPIENTEEYEVVSGHRRLHAAQKAGITEVPALIYALDRDAAVIAVVDSNLHREIKRKIIELPLWCPCHASKIQLLPHKGYSIFLKRICTKSYSSGQSLI